VVIKPGKSDLKRGPKLPIADASDSIVRMRRSVIRQRMWKGRVFAAICAGSLLLPTTSAAQIPQPVKGTTPTRPSQEAGATNLPVFEFHSGLWINLHHVLYQQARERLKLVSARQEAVPGDDFRLEGIEKLSPSEAAAWNQAVGFYGREFAERDLQFNSDLVILKNRLEEWETEPTLATSGLRPAVIQALEQAAPIYRARWWPEHDRANRTWIAAAAPLVREYGVDLSRQLAAVYQASWPSERIRVDVTVQANWAGAYTTLDPLRVTVSSTDPRNQGMAALEVLFHEASHGIATSVSEAIARECRLRNKPIPRDLWHALLFYTTGDVVKRAVKLPETCGGKLGDSYTPYAQRYGLYTRGWQNFQRLLERYWQPYLDGKVEFDSALARLVAAL